ncbi:MAG TPA: GNAT family N-acetyltransferase [Planctomycetota bacterium]|nr:GNAT family N-acetyltransferase [Planctomycetota bacterium]
MAKPARKPAPPVVRVSGMQTPNDRREALDTILRAFTHPEHLEQHVAKACWRGSYFNPDYTRIAVADGRVVSAVVLAPRTIRFGPARVPAMTVGTVATHDHYRKRGYNSVTMNDASAYMQANGVLVAYLGGIPDYYHRYGYYPFTTRGSAKFNREAARKEMTPARFRVMRKTDLPAVAELYDRANAASMCTADRPADLWQWLMGPGRNTWFFRGPYVVFDPAGKLCGYFTSRDKQNINIGEIVVRGDDASCRAMLGALVSLAKRREVKDISLPLPWNYPMAVFLRQYVPCEFTMNTNPTGGCLMKIVDFPRLMAALEPMFAERWRAADPKIAAARFTFECELGSVGFSIAGGAVRVEPAARTKAVVRVPQRWMSGLLTGYYDINEVLPREGVLVPDRLKPVLRILFPKRWPWVHCGDNY